MNDLKKYPKYCRKNIIKLMYMLSVNAETAYGMLKMTAMTLDMDLDDDGVYYAILMDCGPELYTEERA